MTSSPSGFLGKHTDSEDPAAAAISEETVRAAQDGCIWLNALGELCNARMTEVTSEPCATLDILQSPVSIQDFFHVGIRMCHTVHALNERGVFLRITSLTHWGLSAPGVHTDLGAGIPVLCNVPFAVRMGEVRSITFDHDDVLSRHLPNVPPELIREAAAVRFPVACDVYSLAATLYHLLTGKPCLDVDTSQYTSQSARLLERAHAALAMAPLPPSMYRRGIPPELDAILLKALSKVPTQRYVSGRSLAKDLAKLQISLSDLAYPRVSIGAVDELLRLEPPHMHYGREEAEETLRKALARAVKGKSAFVVLSGSSGTGKTVTAETLISEVSRAGGLWISVKAQLQSNRSLSVLSGIANSLLRPLLLIPGVDIAQWQREVLQTVGNAAMSILSPWVDVDLRLPFGFPIPEVEEDTANPLKRSAAEGAVVRLLACVLKYLKPVVIFIDDGQWLQGPDIIFVESLLDAAKQDIPGLFILCAQRPIDEKDSAQTAFRLSSLSSVFAASPQLVHLGSLAPQDIFDMLRDLLGPRQRGPDNPVLTPYRTDELQQIVSLMTEASAPTPMFCRQVLLTMRDRHILTFNWDTELWQFNESAAAEVAPDLHSADSTTFLLHNVLRHFSQQAQNILIAAATISGTGPFTTETIAAATGLNEVTILPTLVQAVQRRILSTVVSEAGDVNTDEKAATNDDVSYVFTHDQWIEASYALCPPMERAEMHRNQAHRLAKHPESYTTLVAANIKSAINLDLSFTREEMNNFKPIVIRASRIEVDRRKTEDAIAYLEIAVKFLGDEYDLTEFQDVHQLLFDSYFSATRTREAAVIADKLKAHARTDVEKLHAASMQLRCLAILNPHKGIDYCCSILLQYTGIDVMETAKTIALRKEFLPSGPEPFMSDERPTELNLIIQRIMVENITLFYPMDAAVGMSLIWNTVLYAQNFNYAHKYIALGDKCVKQTQATPYQVVEFHFSRDSASHFIKRSWTEAGQAYLRTAYHAYDIALYEIAIYSIAHTTTILFWSEVNLQEIIAIGHHVAPQCRYKTGAGWVFGAIVPQVAYNLVNGHENGNTMAISGLFVPPGAYEQTSQIQMHELQWSTYEFVLNLIFRQPTWPIYVRRRDKHCGSGLLMQTVMYTYICALAVLEGMASGEEIQDGDRQLVAKTMENFTTWSTQTDAKEQYTTLLLLLKAAEIAAKDGALLDDIIEAYDEAIAAAHAMGIHVLQALASEAAAMCILKLKPKRLRMAEGYILNCYRSYNSWGAQAKCAALAKEFPHLFLDVPVSIPLTSSSLPSQALSEKSLQSNGRLDLAPQSSSSTFSVNKQTFAAIPSDSRDWLDGKNGDATPLDIASLLAATHSWQMEDTVEHDRGLRLRAAGSAEALQSDLDLALEDAASLAPIAILEYVERTGQAATSAILSITSLQDKFIFQRRPVSIVALPIMLQNKVAGILYLDSPTPSAFSASDLSVISSLSTQALLVLERTTYSRLLERKVEERTAELSQRNQELEDARKAAEDAKDAENRFLLRMSHELRTPANSVIVLADLLQEAPLDGLYYEYVSQIKASSQQLRGIIHDILDWSKLSSQEMVAESIPFNLRDCIETAVQTLAEQANSKGLEMCYSTPTNNDLLTMVVGDEFRCKQILLNLLSNAVRFTSAPGFVTVSCSYGPADDDPVGDELLIRICVQDSGIGVPKNKHSVLFKSFTQVDESITRLYGGSGLGLAISRSLARLLGGDAWIDPTSGDGAGSKFWFSFVVKRGQILPPPPTLTLRLRKQARALVWAPLLVTTDILVSNLSALGVDCRAVETYAKLPRSLVVGSMNIVIADMLHASDEEQNKLQDLIKLPYFHGLVVIGSSQKATELLSLESRVVFLMRPAKAQSLNNAVLGLLDKSIPRSSMSSTPKVPTLPKLNKDYPITILAVDDNDVNRLVFRRVLERLGYTAADITLESDGEKAVSACRLRRFDLVLMDSEMPVMDGTTAMRYIREEHGGKAPYMAVVTASAMPGDRDRFIGAGFNAYLSKPLVLPALAETIRNAYTVKQGNEPEL